MHVHIHTRAYAHAYMPALSNQHTCTRTDAILPVFAALLHYSFLNVV